MIDALTAMPAEQARQLVDAWEADAKRPACEFFRPGTFDITEGERVCASCRVPLTIHRAYRVLTKGGRA